MYKYNSKGLLDAGEPADPLVLLQVYYAGSTIIYQAPQINGCFGLLLYLSPTTIRLCVAIMNLFFNISLL
jgi:hypothetical protein